MKEVQRRETMYGDFFSLKCEMRGESLWDNSMMADFKAKRERDFGKGRLFYSDSSCCSEKNLPPKNLLGLG